MRPHPVWIGLLLALGLTLPAWAQCARPYQVGVSPLGWGVFEERQQLRGFVPDLIRALEARSGCTLQLKLRPRARVLLEFSAGQLDLITSAQAAPERDAVGEHVPYATTMLDLVLGPGAPPDLRSLEQLMRHEGMSLGLVRGVHLGPKLAPLIARLAEMGRIELASDFENLAERLKAGRFQAAIYPNAIHSKQRHDGLLPPQVRVLELPEAEPQVIGLYLQRQTIPEADRRRLQTAMRQMVADGEVEAAYRRYLGADEARRLFRAR
ncbi:MAG: transporter substrate-binding domain-containing protein [Inhella sp.]